MMKAGIYTLNIKLALLEQDWGLVVRKKNLTIHGLAEPSNKDPQKLIGKEQEMVEKTEPKIIIEDEISDTWK